MTDFYDTSSFSWRLKTTSCEKPTGTDAEGQQGAWREAEALFGCEIQMLYDMPKHGRQATWRPSRVWMSLLREEVMHAKLAGIV